MSVDQKIIEGCIAGKRKAQNQLYNMYSAGMLGICLRYCRSLEDAEDVLQEGFIKVFRNINAFRGDGSIGSWIKRIMINTAISHNKKLINQGNNLADNMDFEETENEDNELLPVDPETLIKLIQELPEGYRTVLNLYVFEGYSHKEIAETMNISESTSKTQLFKARKFLKNKLLPVITNLSVKDDGERH